MILLPQNSADVPKPQSGSARKNPRGYDDAEEIPQPADERATRELIRQEAPRKRRCPDETREKPDV